MSPFEKPEPDCRPQYPKGGDVARIVPASRESKNTASNKPVPTSHNHGPRSRSSQAHIRMLQMRHRENGLAQFPASSEIFLRNSHQNSHSGAKKDNRLWGRLVKAIIYLTDTTFRAIVAS